MIRKLSEEACAPSNTVINLEALNAITLRSGKVIETGSTSDVKKKDKSKVAEDWVEIEIEEPAAENPSTPPPSMESMGKEVVTDDPPSSKHVDVSSSLFHSLIYSLALSHLRISVLKKTKRTSLRSLGK